MKIPAPKKLPSGRWYIQVMVDGKRLGQSFDTDLDAIYWASGIKTKSIEETKSPRSLSVSEAVDRYIDSKSAVLSPSTIVGYKRIKDGWMGSIQSVKLPDLTQEKIQRWVNQLAKEKSPKTVANAHGLLSAVLAEYKPAMALRTTLPQRRKHEVKIPSEHDIKAILSTSKGTRYELPILLATWLGLRESEILGLTWDCLDGDYLQIKQAVVIGEDGPVMKSTKSYSGTRKIRLPAYIKELIQKRPHTGDRIMNCTGTAIYRGFCRVCDKAGVPHYRFHDLRHFNASVMLAAHIPDKYSMKRMGHATSNMLKTTYQHTIQEKELEYDDLIDESIQQFMTTD